MANEICAQITGNVWKVLVKPGDKVVSGDTLVILESMKMEIPVEAEDDGSVVEIRVKEGEAIDEGAVIALMS